MFDKTREKITAPVRDMAGTIEIAAGKIGGIVLATLFVALTALLISALAMFKGAK